MRVSLPTVLVRSTARFAAYEAGLSALSILALYEMTQHGYWRQACLSQAVDFGFAEHTVVDNSGWIRPRSRGGGWYPGTRSEGGFTYQPGAGLHLRRLPFGEPTPRSWSIGGVTTFSTASRAATAALRSCPEMIKVSRFYRSNQTIRAMVSSSTSPCSLPITSCVQISSLRSSQSSALIIGFLRLIQRQIDERLCVILHT